MGTNYYAVQSFEETEKEMMQEMLNKEQYNDLKDWLNKKCEPIHIGTSSCGWKFLFNWNKGKYYEPTKSSLNDFLSKYRLLDEYGREVSLEEFWEMVRKKDDGIDNAEYYKKYEKGRILIDEEEYDEKISIYNPQFYEFYSDGLRFSTITEFC